MDARGLGPAAPETQGGLLEAAAIAAFVFAACMAGIHSRLLFSLGSVWPANALLFSLVVLRPGSNRPPTWILSAAAYVLADLTSGSALFNNLVLNGANLVGVATGVMVATRLPSDTLTLKRPHDPVLVVLVMAVASAGTAVGGTVGGPLLFGLSVVDSALLWWSTEMVNYAIVVPLVLALAGTSEWRILSRHRRLAVWQAAALGLLCVCTGLATWIGGPGALVLPLPALIWCAVSFRPWVSQGLAAAVCAWWLVAVPFGWMSIGAPLDDALSVSSFRAGLAMLAIGPFAIAALNDAWRTARIALTFAATHDGLTGLRNRTNFIDRLTEDLHQVSDEARMSVLIADIDHFKRVNDTFGHLAGDAALKAVADCFSAVAQPHHVVARLGGEEFAIALGGTGAADAYAIAEEIRKMVDALEIVTPGGAVIRVTVSIGVRACSRGDNVTQVLAAADAALYDAKSCGRNLVVLASMSGGLPDVVRQAGLAIADHSPYSRPRIRSAGG